MRHNFRCRFVCVLVFVLVVGLVLRFLLKHAFFELIPVEVGGLLLLVGREDRYAFDFGVEDARLHHVRFVLDEVAIVRVDLSQINQVVFTLYFLLISLDHLELNDCGTFVD